MIDWATHHLNTQSNHVIVDNLNICNSRWLEDTTLPEIMNIRKYDKNEIIVCKLAWYLKCMNDHNRNSYS